MVRLEEQVVSYRQGLYQEAVYISSKRNNPESPSSSSNNGLKENSPVRSSKHHRSKSMSQHEFNSMITPPKKHHQQSLSFSRSISTSRKLFSTDQRVAINGKQASPKTSLTKPVDVRGKENQIKESPEKRLVGRFLTSVKKKKPLVKPTEVAAVVQLDDRLEDQDKAQEIVVSGSSSEDKSANRVSEDLLKCLVSIILRISSSKDTVLDPYSNCSEWRARELGAYKNLVSVDASSNDLGRRTNASFLIHRLK